MNSYTILFTPSTPINSKQLVAEVASLYRLRIGDYRIIYQIDGGKLVVLVVHVGHRKDVYRYLKR